MLSIEVASRSNTGEELETKTQLYLEHGAEEVWILYPKTRTLVVSNRNRVDRILEGETYRCEMLDLNVVSNFWIPIE